MLCCFWSYNNIIQINNIYLSSQSPALYLNKQLVITIIIIIIIIIFNTTTTATTTTTTFMSQRDFDNKKVSASRMF